MSPSPRGGDRPGRPGKPTRSGERPGAPRAKGPGAKRTSEHAAPRGAEPRDSSSRGSSSRGSSSRGSSSRGAASDRPASGRSAARPGGGSGKRPSKPLRTTLDGHQLSKAGGTVVARDEGPVRVQRALARAGVLSRREADQAVADGRVMVNGTPALVGQVVDPATDVITLDGKSIAARITEHRWIVLHKPAAVMTTRKDPAGRPTVFDLVKDVPGLVYVGRLDFMTEGVLLLTTDGAAAHALTHPSREVERTYVATVQGDAVTAAREARRGVKLEDGLVVPREVLAHPLGNRRWAFEITITEGKTHEVRRICDALGLEVERLVRTRFGPVRIGQLPSGEARALTPAERTVLKALVEAR